MKGAVVKIYQWHFHWLIMSVSGHDLQSAIGFCQMLGGAQGIATVDFNQIGLIQCMNQYVSNFVADFYNFFPIWVDLDG